MSSRPGHGIEHSPHFTVCAVEPLGPQGYKAIVSKCAEPNKAAEILAQLDGSSSNIVPVLSTPLMVGLLLVRFRVAPSPSPTITT